MTAEELDQMGHYLPPGVYSAKDGVLQPAEDGDRVALWVTKGDTVWYDAARNVYVFGDGTEITREQYLDAYPFQTQPAEDEQRCTCDMPTLMQTGCQCGGK